MPSVEGLGQVVRFERKPDEVDDLDPPDLRTPTSNSHVALAHAVLHRVRLEQRDAPEPVFVDGDLYVYRDGIWAALDQEGLRRAVHDLDAVKPLEGRRITLTASAIDGVLKEMRSIAAAPDFFAEAHPGLACADGFVALRPDGRLELEPLTPEHRVRWRFHGRWDPQGFTRPPPGSLLNRLIKGCFGDAALEYGDVIAEIAGVAATGIATRLAEPKAVILHGPLAANGKSQVLTVLRGLVPEGAASTITPEQMTDPRFRVQLRGALLNAADELSGAVIAGDTFKQVVTGDLMSARDIYQPMVSFRPIAQHVFATNMLPPFKAGMDRGVRRRLLVIPFERSIPLNERVPEIGRRIVEEEGELVLSWALAGAARVYARSALAAPQRSVEALDEWAFQADMVRHWVATNPPELQLAPEQTVATREAYRAFCSWADGEGYDAFHRPRPNTFTSRINGLGLAHLQYRRRGGGGVWVGVSTRRDR